MKQFVAMLVSLFIVLPIHAQDAVSELADGEIQQQVDTVSTAEDANQQVQSKPVFRLKDEIESANNTKSGGDLGEMVLGLMAVLAIIFALAWLSKRFNLNMPGSSSNMKLLSAMSVGQKEKIMLVEVEGETMLLGVTPHQINLLKAFDTGSVTPESEQDNGRKGEFATRMQALLKAEVSPNG
ncbi:flagellar biosynthetic protein FliO [Ketobacter alkanivorans]|nr:flagellar biosynthetic protein FliO [Ketobacter alkanivorans]